MPKCSNCGGKVGMVEVDIFSGLCPKCREEEGKKKSESKRVSGYADHLNNHPLPQHEHLAIPVTTTAEYPSYRIVHVHGIVCGETVMGAHFFKDLFAQVRDIVGGRSASYENELRGGRSIAISELKYEAYKLGANCVVGVSLDYETVGDSMFMVHATGTAVTVEPLQSVPG